MEIFIASDHGGFALKEYLVKHMSFWLREAGALEGDNIKMRKIMRGENIIVDLGPQSATLPVDYPDYAQKIGQKMSLCEFSRGILICRTGIGMSIAANRFNWVRAALCRTENDVIASRLHNDANILVLGADWIECDYALKMCKIFLVSKFDGSERHGLRVKKLSDIF